jgi:hypothetical protein
MAHHVATEILQLATSQHRQELAEAERERKESLHSWQMRLCIAHAFSRTQPDPPHYISHDFQDCTVYADFSHDGQGTMRWSFMGAKHMLTDKQTAKDCITKLLIQQHHSLYPEGSLGSPSPRSFISLRVRLLAGRKSARGSGWTFPTRNTLVARSVTVNTEVEPGSGQVDLVDLRAALEELLTLGMSARVE